MSLSALLLYAVACGAMMLIPGPTTLLALANGARGNGRVVAWGVAGAALSDVILISAVGLGLGALLIASEVLFTAVKWLGVAYLVWLAIGLWRSQPQALPAPTARSADAPMAAFWRSLGVALSNPKGLLFFAAFLPQFIAPGEPLAAQYATLAALTAALDVAVLSAYALGGAHAARCLSAVGMRRLHRGCAGGMLSLAGALAFAGQAQR